MDGHSRLGLADSGRQRDADGLEDTSDGAGDRRAQNEVLALLFGFDLLQAARSLSSAAHSGFTRAAARRSSRALRSTSARNEQNTWPRMASSVW